MAYVDEEVLVWDKISGVRGGRAVSVVRVQLDMADGAVVGLNYG